MTVKSAGLLEATKLSLTSTGNSFTKSCPSRDHRILLQTQIQFPRGAVYAEGCFILNGVQLFTDAAAARQASGVRVLVSGREKCIARPRPPHVLTVKNITIWVPG